MTDQDKLVGMDGMGCNEACAQVSVAASSMRVLSLGYDCAADYLSDSERTLTVLALSLSTSKLSWHNLQSSTHGKKSSLSTTKLFNRL